MPVSDNRRPRDFCYASLTEHLFPGIRKLEALEPFSIFFSREKRLLLILLAIKKYLVYLTEAATIFHAFILPEKKCCFDDSSLVNGTAKYSRIKNWQIDWLFGIPLWTRRGLEIPHKYSRQLLLMRRPQNNGF